MQMGNGLLFLSFLHLNSRTTFDDKNERSDELTTYYNSFNNRGDSGEYLNLYRYERCVFTELPI